MDKDIIENVTRNDAINFILNHLPGYSDKVERGVSKIIDEFIRIHVHRTVFCIKGYIDTYFVIIIYYNKDPYQSKYKYTIEIVDEDYVLEEDTR